MFSSTFQTSQALLLQIYIDCYAIILVITSLNQMATEKNVLLQKVLKDWFRFLERQELFPGLHTGLQDKTSKSNIEI